MPDDFVVGRQADALVAEDFLHGDHVAFHAGDFGDRRHAARPVLQGARPARSGSQPTKSASAQP